MSNLRDLPRAFWKLMKGPILLYKLGLGRFAGNLILLLTTTGRKSNLPRITPLQYERINNEFYVAAARGVRSDWVRNIIVDPNVKIQVGLYYFNGFAEQVTHIDYKINFVNLRLKRHPRMMVMMLRVEGLKIPLTHDQLLKFVKKIVLVKITIQSSGS